MRSRILAVTVLVGLGLVGCAQVQPVANPSVSTSVSASPTASDMPATLSPQASPAAPTPSAAPWTVPSTIGAVDVSSFGPYASFANPSGKTFCALSKTNALCHFPTDYAAKVPSSKDICPGDETDVTGVSVARAKAAYFCSGDPQSYPQTDSDSVGWWKSTGYPTVKADGENVVVLPYNKALVYGSFVCQSTAEGVDCGNTSTGKGFQMTKDGARFN